MSRDCFIRRTRIEASAETVFRWHARPGAFERLTPPWVRVTVVHRTDGIQDGARVSLDLRMGPAHIPWVVEHRDYQEDRQFRDVQLSGPFRRWEHTHQFEPDGPSACYMQDRVEYALPLGPVGELLGARFVEDELERFFVYRHRVIKSDLVTHAGRASAAPLRVLVTGSSGLIGSSLVPFLTTGGHGVARLVRAAESPRPDVLTWDPAAGRINPADLEGFDAVVHLAGESIGSLRWSPEKKERIRRSRIGGTRLLCETLAGLARPPRVLVAASAVGWYGHRGGEVLHEESDPGSGFLADLCREWEAATKPAADQGIRVVNLRFGVVLSPAGGMLARLLPLYLAGLGGPLGSGWQYVGWIAIDDAVGAIHHALTTASLSGPVNAVSPYVVINRDLNRTLGAVVRRPSFLPVPAFAARLAFGEVADEVLLASARAEPRRLVDSGYSFLYPDLEIALRHVLGRTL